MIVYLDQNKWIELAKMVHGKDNSTRAKNVVRDFEAAIDGDHVVVPLSAFHYMETARVSNAERRRRLKTVINDMPTRYLDLHLHRQVLRNPNYASKITDLEDWSGVGVASCYCDVVVCEKHMADMLKRDRFVTKARIETDLEKTFVLLSNT